MLCAVSCFGLFDYSLLHVLFFKYRQIGKKIKMLDNDLNSKQMHDCTTDILDVRSISNLL